MAAGPEGKEKDLIRRRIVDAVKIMAARRSRAETPVSLK